MAEEDNPWQKFLDRPNTDRGKTLGVAFLVAVACGVAVSTTAVSLRPRIETNIANQRQELMAAMLATLPGIGEILTEAGADAVETMVINLDTGLVEPAMDPASFDATAVAASPETSTPLGRAEDLAGIGRRENYAQVYVLRKDGELKLVVLPVYGNGYQSTIRAYLALEPDLNTVAALTVFEQGETPGLGGRISEEAWQAQWAGKQIADESGEIAIEVVRGTGTGPFQVDGVSGASVTGNAVTDMIHFWMGPRGFAPFLDNLREGKV